MKYLKKYGWILIVCVVLAIVCICIFPRKIKIDKTLYGIQSRNYEEDYVEEAEVYIEGVYKQYLIKQDTFQGLIGIKGDDIKLEKKWFNLVFEQGASALISFEIDGEEVIYTSFGAFSATPGFEEVVIYAEEPFNDPNSKWKGLFICAPAENREQAVAMGNENLNALK